MEPDKSSQEIEVLGNLLTMAKQRLDSLDPECPAALRTLLACAILTAERPLRELAGEMVKIQESTYKWTGTVKSMASAQEMGKLLDAAKENTQTVLLTCLL